MRQDIRLGRVAGIAVGANWSVAVILALIVWLLGAGILPGSFPHRSPVLYWAAAVAGAVLFLASLLAHEMAHALVARRNGVRVRSITLWMLGGVAELDGEPPDPGADLRIALAGPAASVAAAGVFLATAVLLDTAGASGVAVAAAQWLAFMNGLLAVFNLLPGAPLDGGRVLRAVLWRRYRDRRRADAAAARAGQFLGAAVVAVGVLELLAWHSSGGLWLLLVGWFLLSAASAEQRAATVTARLAGVRIADIMTAAPELAAGWRTVQDFIDTTVVSSRQEAFPVVDRDGRLAGLITAGQLAGISPGDRARLRVGQAALGVPPPYLATPADQAAPLLTRRPLAGQVLAIVLQDGRVAGMVTVTDLQRAIQRARLITAGG